MTAKIEILMRGENVVVYAVHTGLRRDPCRVQVINGGVGRCLEHPFEFCGGPARLETMLRTDPQQPPPPKTAA